MKLRDNEKMILWRKRENMTQRDISNLVGVSQGYISQWELGFRPVPDFALRFCPEIDKVTDGEEFHLRMGRVGYNMTEMSKRLGTNFYRLLKMVRDERPIPKEFWDVLEKVEKKFE